MDEIDSSTGNPGADFKERVTLRLSPRHQELIQFIADRLGQTLSETYRQTLTMGIPSQLNRVKEIEHILNELGGEDGVPPRID